MLAPVNDLLIEALRLDGPTQIAEIGSGGGGATFEIHRQAPAGSVVHGYDVSPALVEAARARIPNDTHSLRFTLADMQTADPPQQYDRLTSRFGVMFFDDPPIAFSQLTRWLAPGGRIAFSVWGSPRNNLWFTVVKDALAQFVDFPPPEPDQPGPVRYADADAFLALLDRSGFSNLHVETWRGELPVGGGLSVDEAAHFAMSSFSLAESLKDQGEAISAEAHQALVRRLHPYERSGAVWLQSEVHIVTGTRL